MTLKTKASVGLATGTFALVAGRMFGMVQNDSKASLIALAALVVGIGLWTWGCVNLAKSKGYPRWLGWLGLLYCVGFIVIVLLPNRVDTETEQVEAPPAEG